jgi:RNA polymerase sigma-70 factor (ECF subfamily)
MSPFLLQQFCNGDNQAFISLYSAWLPELYLVAYRYVHCELDAEDVVADCFEKIFRMSIKERHKKFLEVGINIKALLLVMVKNKSLDVLKTKNNRLRIVNGIKKWFPTVTINHVRQTISDDNFKALLCCLPEKEKTIITMSIEGYENKEIAKELAISEKTVANLLSISRAKIKNLLHQFMY